MILCGLAYLATVITRVVFTGAHTATNASVHIRESVALVQREEVADGVVCVPHTKSGRGRCATVVMQWTTTRP